MSSDFSAAALTHDRTFFYPPILNVFIYLHHDKNFSLVIFSHDSCSAAKVFNGKVLYEGNRII